MSTVIQTYSFSCPGCCGTPPPPIYCAFCPGGIDLPPTFGLTITGSPIVSGTFPHDYTLFNNTYPMTYGVMDFTPVSGITLIDDYTGVVTSGGAGNWWYYTQTVNYSFDGSFYRCDWQSTLVNLGCTLGVSSTGYRLLVTIKKASYASPSFFASCSGKTPATSENWFIVNTGSYAPSNTGNFGDGLSVGSVTGAFVAFNTGDSCSPLYMSNTSSCQLVHVTNVTSPFGTADNTTGVVTITLTP